MAIFFSILVKISLLILVLGLIKPGLIAFLTRETWSRGRILLVFGLALVLFAIGESSGAPNTQSAGKKIDPASSPVVAASAASTRLPTESSTPMVISQVNTANFGVKGLIGKDIDQIRTILGKPADSQPDLTELQQSMGASEWSNTFKKGDDELLVTFNSKTREVVDFFIGAKGGLTKDRTTLLGAEGLKEGASNYSLEFVPALKDPSSYTGVKIKPL